MNLLRSRTSARREKEQSCAGMVFTIEPMINLGKKDLHILADNWTAVTDDRSLSRNSNRPSWSRRRFESLTPFDLDQPFLPDR